MERTTEASLSRQNMSQFKTIYVEGDLDLTFISSFFDKHEISNIRIIRIVADKDKLSTTNYIYNQELGAKSQIKELIKYSNQDGTIDKNKYLGIIDLDFDLCFSEQEDIENLIYTDLNSMESYLIDKDLFKKFAEDFHLNSIEEFESNFTNYIENFQELNLMFVVQVKHYIDFNSNLISFDDVPLNIPRYLDIQDNFKIKSENVINDKCVGCKDTWKGTYQSKKSLINESLEEFNQRRLISTHGKHLLRYLIGIYKNLYNIFKHIGEEVIINSLKDKFIILSKCINNNLFNRLLTFSTS